MADQLLLLAYRITGSERISLMISGRRVNRRWAAAVAAHKATGGVVMTMESDAGSSSYLL